MWFLVRFPAVSAVAAVLAATSWAQIAPTPAGWEPDQAKAKADAYVAERVAVFTRGGPRDEIRQALRLAQMVRPDEPTVTNQLAYYLGEGQPDQAYGDILAFRPDEPVANYYLAQKLSNEGYANLALPFFARAASQRPDDAVVQYHAGMNAFFAEDDTACIAYFTRSLAIGGDSKPVWLKRGECYARAGKKKEAEADFSRAEGNGGAYSVRMFREGVFNGCGWGWGSLDSRVRDAAATADDWKTYEGYRELTRVLECEPNHVGALKERLKLEDRDTNLAQHAKVHRIQLQNLQDGAKTDAARLKALQAPTAAEMLAQGQAIQMFNDAGGEKRMRAAHLASRVLMAEPNNTQARLLRARAIANLGIGPLSALAWDDATRALQADPKLAVAHFVRATLFMRGNGYNEAVGELNAAIAIDPNDMRFYLQRADAHGFLNHHEEAVRDYTRFLTSNPKDMLALQGRAKANFGLKKYQATFNDLDAAFQVDPKNFTVRSSIVAVLDAMGRRADADSVHIALTSDFEAEAKSNSYLAGRMTPELAAKIANQKEGQAFAALEKRAGGSFQAFVDEFSPGEYAYENLVMDMGAATSLDHTKLQDFRKRGEYAQGKLKEAWRIGNALIQSDDAAGLTEEQLVKLASWLAQVESMQKGVADVLRSIYIAQVQ
ncbi:MAG: hypothetical protein EON93_01700 [Burkholderiales bacterium]|nr:MAG: hypothetical protein EON93_01700 [Burkholderiales bacterium]